MSLINLKMNDFKISIALIIFLLFCETAISQQNVTVDLTNEFQTIQGFGASDAWNFDPVGRHWETDVKEEIAELLFSTEITGNTPNGIGLSRWRFNIGGGSTEQGDNSNINNEERRSECFIESVETINGNEVVTYDWDKQLGQQWFLNAANNYGVSQLVAFVNSPPRFYTKNGRTNSDNTNRFGTTNLGATNYNRFSDFLVTVLKHFSDEGIEFSQISPINEPQYPWNSNQEGCPWKHDEVYKLAEKLNRDILAKGLSTKILLSEAADYRYLTGVKDDSDKSDIIDNYFDTNSPYYMGDFSQVLPGIGSHSYWINGSDESIASVRQSVSDKLENFDDLEIYQTEYNLLNQHYDDKLMNAVFLAKIIYSDLEITGVSIWDYWTAIERERWSQLNRFYLLRLIPEGGNYASLENSGTVNTDKNLWALGNFSRFIRPGYKRIKTTGADDLNGLMGVSFIAPDYSELVTVYVNWSDNSIDIQENLTNLPNGTYAGEAEVFITDATNDLTKNSNHILSNSFTVPSKSVVTFRIPILTDNKCLEQASVSKIEAEDYCESSDINTENASEGTLNVGWINNDDWTSYTGIDLTGMKSVKVRVAGNDMDNTIEVRLDAIDGDVIAEIPISSTGGFQNWKTDSVNIIQTTGLHDIYLVYKGGNGYLFNINWFGFSDEENIITSTPPNPNEVMTVYPNPTSGVVQFSSESNYQIADLVGNVIEKGKGLSADLSNQNPGVYSLSIFKGQQVFQFKLVKQ